MTRPISDIMAEMRAKVRGERPTEPSSGGPTKTSTPFSSENPTPVIVGFVPLLSRKLERRRNHTRSEFVRLAHQVPNVPWSTQSLLPPSEQSSAPLLELVLFGDWFGIEIGRWAIDAEVPYEIVLPFGDAPVAAMPGPSTNSAPTTS